MARGREALKKSVTLPLESAVEAKDERTLRNSARAKLEAARGIVRRPHFVPNGDNAVWVKKERRRVREAAQQWATSLQENLPLAYEVLTELWELHLLKDLGEKKHSREDILRPKRFKLTYIGHPGHMLEISDNLAKSPDPDRTHDPIWYDYARNAVTEMMVSDRSEDYDTLIQQPLLKAIARIEAWEKGAETEMIARLYEAVAAEAIPSLIP